MKKLFFVAICYLVGTISMIGQSECSKFYPFKEGTKFQITSYDKNDKSAGAINYIVKESSGNKATLAFEMKDEKGKLVTASEYDMTCENDGISIDFKSLLAPGILEQYEDMEVDISGTNLILPNSLSSGQTLPDSNMLMNVKMTPINMKMTVNITNRKVEGMEEITMPAGTFECYVLSYDQESKMGIKVRGSAKQWLAKDVGMVKQETYNKKGKIIGKSLLTKFEK